MFGMILRETRKILKIKVVLLCYSRSVIHGIGDG